MIIGSKSKLNKSNTATNPIIMKEDKGVEDSKSNKAYVPIFIYLQPDYPNGMHIIHQSQTSIKYSIPLWIFAMRNFAN